MNQSNLNSKFEEAGERAIQITKTYISAYTIGDMKTCSNLLMEHHELIDTYYALLRGMVDDHNKNN